MEKKHRQHVSMQRACCLDSMGCAPLAPAAAAARAQAAAPDRMVFFNQAVPPPQNALPSDAARSAVAAAAGALVLKVCGEEVQAATSWPHAAV